MAAEASQALASTGGSALVAAMATDSWEELRARIARVLGRGEAEDTQAALDRLDRSRAALARLSGSALELAQAEQELIWRTRLGDLLEIHPDTEDEVRVLIAGIQQHLIRPVGSQQVIQHLTGFDKVQHAVRIHGVQNITSSGQDGPARASKT